MATISEIPPETNNIGSTNPPTTNAPVSTTTQTVTNTTTANFLTIKLHRNNYSLWLAQITPLLKSKNLMGFVNGTKPCPPAFLHSASGEPTDAINPAYEEWMATDKMILGWINGSLTPSVLSTVSRSISSHTTWASLSRRYASPNHNRILQLRSTLLRTTRGDLSFSDYLDKINQVADTLALSGHPVADEDLISVIMNNIVPLYEHTISSAQARETPITYDGLEALLLAAESRLHNHNNINLESAPTALVTNRSSTGGSRGRGSFNISPRGRGNYSPRGSFTGPSSYSRGSSFRPPSRGGFSSDCRSSDSGWHSSVKTMASSSTYDVYLSFRGTDTRKDITFDLYDALMRRGLKAYLDERDLEIGDAISPTLIKAIQRSRICVIVISENYASAPCCLDELVYIMELWRSEDRLVLPAFYKVDPSHVRKQKHSFGEALEMHHCSGRIDQTTMLEWREALTQVANICGWHTQNYRTDTEFVLDIVKSIQSKGLPTRLNISIYPLGYDMCDEYLKVFLQAGTQEVVIVGICGPGQMGKTAMARVMYDQILHNFDGGCFLADVGKRSDQLSYLVRLQETLLSEILSETSIKISDTGMGRDLIAQNLCSKRVLVVLDNVDDLRQIDALIGDRKFFGPGSKIIITARDVHLLELFGVDQFILAQGRPLPENVAGIWEPYQRSRCVVAGLKEYIETFNHQRLEKLRNLRAVLLQERQKNATQGRFNFRVAETLW